MLSFKTKESNDSIIGQQISEILTKMSEFAKKANKIKSDTLPNNALKYQIQLLLHINHCKIRMAFY